MRKSLVLISMAVAFICPLSARAETPVPTPLVINESQVPIRVDGHLNDWPQARMVVFDQKDQVVSGKVFWKSSEEFNGRVFITYDALYLYVAVIVEKRGEAVNSNENQSLWNGDCLELFLSTKPKSKANGLSEGDYHIGFSPGNECKNPRIFCFNKNKDIVGGRVIARKTNTGYLLEACVPLTFFAGLDLGPGKTAGLDLALDEGGQISGNRLMQLDYSKDPLSREHPSVWPVIQWAGTAEVTVADNHEDDLYAGAVKDGTKGATYAGVRTITGRVLGMDGKPMVGAKVSTWPKSKNVLTDAAGGFTLEKIKIYDKTLFYARMEGCGTALAALPAKGKPVTIFPRLLPKILAPGQDQEKALMIGQAIKLPASNNLDDATAGTVEIAAALQLKFLRLSGTELSLRTPGSEYQVIDKFVAYAKAIGAEPLIEVPIGPEGGVKAGDWVRYCNVEKKYHVLYWTVGDEPDTYDMKTNGESFSNYSAYDYINDFRTDYNAMKTADPSIFVMGPELAWKYTDGENDWLTPFVQYNGDIVDAVSVHRYASLKAAEGGVKKVLSDIRGEEAVLRDLRDKVSGHSDFSIPLVVTGGNVCRESAVVKPNQEDAGPGGFWAALWMGEKTVIFLKEGLAFGLFSYLKGSDGLDVLAATGPKPSYWALKILTGMPAGKLISAQIKQEDISLCALQDAKTKDLTLLLINHGDRYLRPRIRLDGKDADLIVDAGLKQGVDFEIPSFCIACLTIKADNSPGQATVYTKKMFLAGKGPETTVLKPW